MAGLDTWCRGHNPFRVATNEQTCCLRGPSPRVAEYGNPGLLRRNPFRGCSRKLAALLEDLSGLLTQAGSFRYLRTFADTTTTRPLSPIVVLPTTTLSACRSPTGDRNPTF